MIRRLALLLAIASCGYPRPAPFTGDGGGDDGGGGDGGRQMDAGVPCPDCRVLAMTPRTVVTPTALLPSLVTFEGVFDPASGGVVTFAGNKTAPLNVLGTGRATASVPIGARSGAVTVAIDSAPASPAFPLVIASQPGVVRFSRDEQLTGPRPDQNPIHQRSGAFTTVLGDYLYVIGGFSGGLRNDTERALINADGSLGNFTAAASTLTTNDEQFAAVRIGDALYTLGGNNGNTSALIQTATIATDGTLSAFTTTGQGTLTMARAGASAEVIGDYVYVFGGQTTTSGAYTRSIERAAINADGSLGTFTSYSIQLAVPLAYFTTEIVGNQLFVIGGDAGGGLGTTSVTVSQISPTGELGTFNSAGAMSGARFSHASVVLGGSIFAIGGTTSGTSGTGSVEELVVGDGSVTPKASHNLLAARASVAVALVPPYLYVTGSAVTTERTLVDGDSSPFTATNSNFTLSSDHLAGARAYAGTITIGTTLYEISGQTDQFLGTAETDSTTVGSDGTLGTFVQDATMSVTPPSGREGCTIAQFHNLLYVIGGNSYAGTNMVKNTIDVATIDPNARTVGTFALATAAGSNVLMAAPRQDMGAVLVGTSLWLLGGYNNSGVLQSTELATVGSDGTLGQFSLSTISLMTATRAPLTVVIGTTVYLIGGFDGNGHGLATTQSSGMVMSQLSPWQVGPSLSTARGGASGAIIGSYLYVFGGSALDSSATDTGVGVTGTQLQSIERAPITNGQLGSFTAVGGQLAVSREGFALLRIGDQLYALGGTTIAPTNQPIATSNIGTFQVP